MKSPLSFHFFSMTKPISFSFFLSITCSHPVIILDLHRTCSSYTTVSHNVLQMPPQKQTLLALLWRQQPSMQVTFSTAWVHSHSRYVVQVLVHQHPTSFSAKLLSRHAYPSLHYCLGLFHPRCRIFNVPVLNSKRFLSAHSSVLSLWIAVLLCRIPTSSCNLVSPTNLRGIISSSKALGNYFKWHQTQLSPLNMPLKNDFAIGLCTASHNPLNPPVESTFHTLSCPLIESVSYQLNYKDAMGSWQRFC